QSQLGHFRPIQPVCLPGPSSGLQKYHSNSFQIFTRVRTELSTDVRRSWAGGSRVRPRTHRDRLAPEEQVPRGLLLVAPAKWRGRQYQRMKESAQVRYSGATISTMRPASSRPSKPNRHSTNGVGSGSEWLERAATSRIGVSSRMPMPIALASET